MVCGRPVSVAVQQSQASLHTYCHAFRRCCRKAVSARPSVWPPCICACARGRFQAYSGVACSSSSCPPRGWGPGWISSRWPPSAVFATFWANPRCSAAVGVGAKGRRCMLRYCADDVARRRGHRGPNVTDSPSHAIFSHTPSDPTTKSPRTRSPRPTTSCYAHAPLKTFQ